MIKKGWYNDLSGPSMAHYFINGNSLCGGFRIKNESMVIAIDDGFPVEKKCSSCRCELKKKKVIAQPPKKQKSWHEYFGPLLIEGVGMYDFS